MVSARFSSESPAVALSEPVTTVGVLYRVNSHHHAVSRTDVIPAVPVVRGHVTESNLVNVCSERGQGVEPDNNLNHIEVVPGDSRHLAPGTDLQIDRLVRLVPGVSWIQQKRVAGVGDQHELVGSGRQHRVIGVVIGDAPNTAGTLMTSVVAGRRVVVTVEVRVSDRRPTVVMDRDTFPYRTVTRSLVLGTVTGTVVSLSSPSSAASVPIHIPGEGYRR